MATPKSQLPADQAYLARCGLLPDLLEQIGAIAVLAGSIEFWTERAVWALKSENPKGKRPSTDGPPISFAISEIEKLSADITDNDFRILLQLWANTAMNAFKCRNSIFHGLPLSFEVGSASFLINTGWQGEKRQRISSTFVADHHTLALLREVFYTLLIAIIRIQKVGCGEIDIKKAISGDLIASLRRAKSIAAEIENLPAAVNHEKY